MSKDPAVSLTDTLFTKAKTVLQADRAVMVSIFGLALLLRLAAIFYLKNFSSITGYENEEIALNMLAGNGYSMKVFGPLVPTAHQYPLYTFYLFFHFLAFGKNYLWVELSQALLASGSCVLLVYLGRSLFDRLTGALAGLICAFYPIYVYWTCRAQALTLEIFLLIALLVLLQKAWQRDRVGDWAMAGAVFGLGVLSKTLYLSFFPALVLWAGLNAKIAASRLTRGFAVFLLCGAAVIAPWTVRNAVTLHSFVLVSSNRGYNLWVGNNPNATGSMFTRDHQGMWTTIPADLMKAMGQVPDAERNRLLGEAGRAFIREDLGRFLALVPGRLEALWWFDPFMPSDFPLMREVSLILLLIPALLGMAHSRRRWRLVSIFYMIYLIMTLVYSIYYGTARFRYLIEFSFILFAAELLAALLQKRLGGEAAPTEAA